MMRSATASKPPRRARRRAPSSSIRAFVLAAILCGCAGLETSPPSIDEAAIRSERAELQQTAIAHQHDRRRRVASLAWPLLSANADLCGEKTRPAIGAILTTPESAKALARGLRESDIRAAGHAEGLQVTVLVEDGPADKAGLREGDRVLQIDERQIDGDEQPEKALKGLRKALKRDGRVRMSVASPDGPARVVTVEAETVCDFAVQVGRSSAINAYTDGRRLVILPGLERALADDDPLSLVLAHELAHAMLRHPRKLQRNAFLTGGVVIGPAASIAGTVGDMALRLVGAEPAVRLSRSGAALVTYPYGVEFEREADYVGLYLFARAGGNLDGVEDLYTVFSAESPANTWHSISHPTTSERRVAVRLIREEIETKQAAGEPLLPNGWTR
ncbi:MAG: M48 family metalloprotease [Pseudomonadota bacterium]